MESFNAITCLDMSSLEGYLVMGGTSKDGKFVGETNYPSEKAWLGLKLSTATASPTDWAWVLYDEQASMFTYEQCKVS